MTLLKLVTAALSVLMVIWGVFSIINFRILTLVLGVYQGIFGAMMFLSLFDMRIINKNMFILKSTRGKGVFCIFVATTYLVDEKTRNIILASVFAAIGALFIFVGTVKPDMDEVKDITQGDMTKAAFDNRGLLSKVNVKV